MNKKFLFSTIFVILFCASLYAAPLTGTKTIGGASPDYATFAAAVADLNLNGVGTGGVTFSLRNGTYAGGVTITASGTLANPITFQSENLDASLVTISSGGSADVIGLQGASYLTLRALTIDYTGISGYNAVQVGQNSDFVTITDCILDGTDNISSTAFASSAVYASESSAANDCDNFVVSNCTIRNGSYGIYFGMSTSQPAGIEIENNRFENSYGGGFRLENLSAPICSGNTITTTQTGNSSFYGIYLENCDGKNIITANYIYSDGAGEIGYGIYFNGSASTMGNNALIANNSIQISNTLSIAVGIDQSSTSLYYDIFSNTVYVSGGTSSSTYAYRTFSFSDDTKIKNNIFANFASGTGISSNQTVYIANATGVSEASNNDYWTENTGNPFRGNYGGSNYTSLSAYTTALGETNALNINPQMTFVSNVGWKATNPSLTGAGLYFASVPTDIDGYTRQNPTTIGAHENAASAPANDNICSATVLNFGVSTPYNNTGATAEVNEPVPSIANCTMGWCPADGAVQNSVWFTFTMATTKRVRITTTGFDNQISLYSASSCSTAFTFAAASDISGAAGEIPSICLSAGTCYLQIDGFQGASGSGTVILTELTLATPVAIAATNNGCTSFTANWNAVPDGTTYYLDVATDNAFTNFVSGFNNRNAGNVTSFNITSLTAGTTYYYRVRANDGCVASTSNSNVISASTLDLPVAGFSYTVNGLSATFTNSSSNALSHQWNFGDGSTSTDLNPVHTYSTQGNYQTQLIATNTCGSDTFMLTVNLNCTPVNVSISPNSNPVFCEGDSVTLATVHALGNTYQWLKNNQPISGAQTFHYTANESGDYTLSVTDMNNCSGVSTAITVTENPNPVVMIQANGDTTFCQGDDVELSTTSTGLTYQWLKNAQTISNQNASAYTANTTGSYSLSVTDVNNCTATSNAITVTVNDLPTVTLAAFDTVCTTDAPFELTGGTPSGGNYFVDTAIIFTPFNPAAGAGTYRIIYAYSDTNNCSSNAFRDLVVQICIGVEDIFNGQFTVFPNPVSEFLTIKNSGRLHDNCVAQIYDATGKEVVQQRLTNQEANIISIRNLPAGNYLLKIVSENKTIREAKISIIR